MKNLILFILCFLLFNCANNKVEHIPNFNKHNQLGNGYSVLNGDVYYKESVPSYSSYHPRPEKTEINFKSFTNLNYKFVKDSKNIYYEGKTLIGSDYESFSVIPIDEEFPTLPEEDFHEFTLPVHKNNQQLRPSGKMDMMPFKKHSMIIILEYYAKDKNNVYYGCDTISKADPETFQILSILFSKDKDFVYFCGNPIIDSNPNSFELIFGRLAKDNVHVYYNDQIISNNPSSFTLLGNNYATDNQFVWYYSDTLLPISRLDTLRVSSADQLKLIADRYVEDSKNVYVNGSKIEKADVNTFQLLGGFWSKDDQHIFLFDKICEEADYETFEVTPEGARDRNRTYDKNYRIRD